MPERQGLGERIKGWAKEHKTEAAAAAAVGTLVFLNFSIGLVNSMIALL